MALLQFYSIVPDGGSPSNDSDTYFTEDELIDIVDQTLSTSDLDGTPYDGAEIYTETITAKGGVNAPTYNVIVLDVNGVYYYAAADGGTLPTDVNFRYDELASIDGATGPVDDVVICFVAGTMILTPTGEVPVESLQPGDTVLTLDHGPQTVRWVGRRTVSANGELAPVRIEAGAIDGRVPTRELMVSPWHRMMISGWRAQALFGEPELLVPARDLINDKTIRPVEDMKTVEYVHILFDRHEIVWADGAPSESFNPAELALEKVGEAVRGEILTLFPELRDDYTAFGRSARPTVTGRDARALF
ncbi:Hint domain-containing protein [Halovulum sp. GXIMD14794]